MKGMILHLKDFKTDKTKKSWDQANLKYLRKLIDW